MGKDKVLNMNNSVDGILKMLEGLNALEGLEKMATMFAGHVVFSTSFGMEDQVITDMIAQKGLPVKLFTLDTGRLFQETYDVMEATMNRYKLPVEVFFPETASVEKLMSEKGPNSFYYSLENRLECCRIRKTEPLRRALKGNRLWISGLRAEQSAYRAKLQQVEWDPEHEILKYHPLLEWSFLEVQQYIAQHHVPCNVLHTQGFPSIGCRPCTRAVAPGEEYRAGRWWWENSHKECGLHQSKHKPYEDHQ